MNLTRVAERIRQLDRATWVFCGDSITEAMTCTDERRNYVELVAGHVHNVNQLTMHVFINSAIAGNATPDILETLDYRVLGFRPDIFSLMAGMNDCARIAPRQFSENLRSIIGRVRSACASQIILQTCNSIHPDLHPERDAFAQFMDIIRDTAEELGTALIDHQAAWEQTRLTDRAVFDSWMADRGHPNAHGHRAMAARIIAALGLGALNEPAQTATAE